MFTSSSKKKAVSSQADRSLFGKTIITEQSWKIEVKDMLQHGLGPMPWALTLTAQGFSWSNVQLVNRSPNTSATVIDGMALVQKVRVERTQIAFRSLASPLMAMVLLEGLDSSRINFVFGTY